MPIRDEIVRQKTTLDKKQDVLPVFRAVLCDSAGLTTGSGSVWADEDERLVWYRKIGSTQAAQVRCVRLEPELGLGVLIGYAEGSNEQEVLSDDPFLRASGLGGRTYLSVSGRDLEPGGRLQMWLYSEAFVPLATLAGTGLSVSVVRGDYEAADGTRKTFNGQLNKSIAAHQPAGPTQHCLVGIYLDTANALQTVAGATVATSATAPEPSWPATAVRLAVVDLDDTQTTINFANDIADRRLYFPYPGSGAILKTFLDAKGDLITATAADTPAILTVGTDGYVLTADSGEAKGIKWAAAPSGWPYSQVLTVDASDPDADYSTVGAAITAASAGDVIEIGSDISEASVTLSKALTLRAVSPEITLTITASTSGLNITTSGARVENITVTNTTAGTTAAVYCNPASGSVTLENVTAINNSGSTDRRGITVAAYTAYLINCEATATGGAGADYGLLASGTTVVANIRGGKYTGDTDDIYVGSGDAANLSGLPEFVNGLVFVDSAGSMTGDYTSGGDLLNRTRVHQAVWFDYALVDKLNESGITSHFKDNDSSYPAGWTETSAAGTTNTNTKYSFWYLTGTSADTDWKYRIKSSINLEAITASNWASFIIGPVLIRQTDYTANWSFRFGLYRDNAGSIDEQTYIRVLVYWNSGATSWEIQGEEKDGTTAHAGTAYTLDQVPIVQPFYLRVAIQNAAAKTARAYTGTAPVGDSHFQLLSRAPSSAPTWGDLWVQIHRDRGLGISDYIYIGGIDYVGNIA